MGFGCSFISQWMACCIDPQVLLNRKTIYEMQQYFPLPPTPQQVLIHSCDKSVGTHKKIRLSIFASVAKPIWKRTMRPHNQPPTNRHTARRRLEFSRSSLSSCGGGADSRRSISIINPFQCIFILRLPLWFKLLHILGVLAQARISFACTRTHTFTHTRKERRYI